MGEEDGGGRSAFLFLCSHPPPVESAAQGPRSQLLVVPGLLRTGRGTC